MRVLVAKFSDPIGQIRSFGSESRKMNLMTHQGKLREFYKSNTCNMILPEDATRQQSSNMNTFFMFFSISMFTNTRKTAESVNVICQSSISLWPVPKFSES